MYEIIMGEACSSNGSGDSRRPPDSDSGGRKHPPASNWGEHKCSEGEALGPAEEPRAPAPPQEIVYYCQVRGVTRRHGGDPTGAAGAKLFAVGDPVEIVPDPQNPESAYSLRVLRSNGQPIGYISGRQAERLAGRLHRLTASIHSWDKDPWDNDVLNLLVAEAPELPPGEFAAPPAAAPAPQPAPGTPAQNLLQQALALPLRKVLLGSLLISCVGLALVDHSWWPLGLAGGVLGIIAILRIPHS